ncbi:MAG: MFS transporter [Terriglobales bacterium]
MSAGIPTRRRPPATALAARRWALLATADAGMFIFGLVLLLMGAWLPSLPVSTAQAGYLGSLPLLGILAATVVCGPWLDRAGARPVLAVGLVLVAAALALMPDLVGGDGLLAAAFVYGLGGGLLNTATNALVADLAALTPQAEAQAARGRALNLLGFFFSLGAIASPLLMAASGPHAAGTVVRALAALTALVLLPVLLLPFPPAARPGSHPRDLLRVLHQPLVWLFGALLFFESGQENAMFVWAGKIAQSALGADARRAALVLVALSAALGAGRLLAVGWLRWLGNRWTLRASALAVIVGASLAIAAGRYGLMLAAFLVVGFGFAAIYPSGLGLAGDRFPADTGTAFGAVITLSLLGGTAGPWLASRLAAIGPRWILALPLAASVAVLALSGAVTRAAPHG